MPKACPYCKEEYSDYSDHITQKHPITCEDTKKNINGYFFGKLEEETDERVIIHLSKCSSCYEELMNFRQEQVQLARAAGKI